VIHAARAAALGLAWGIAAGTAACGAHATPVPTSYLPASVITTRSGQVSATGTGADRELATRLDTILADPALARALVAVRIESLLDGRLLYARQPDVRVIPASTMKVVTAAVAAERLGWDFRFDTRLEAIGPVRDGVLVGDLVVWSSGDPSIAAQDLRGAPLFEEWAAALRSAGIRRVDGRLIGDDSAFDDEPLGAGWAWDYVAAGYAAPSGALSYNENVAVLRFEPGPRPGVPAAIELGPPGHGLHVVNEVTTTDASTPASIALARLPSSATLTVRGSVPVSGGILIRTTSVDNPTRFFVEGLRLALVGAGIPIRGGAWDIDDIQDRPAIAAAAERRRVAEHRSEPLSSLIGYAMKVSQNFYGDMLLKAVGRTWTPASAAAGPQPNTTERGRRAVRETLTAWQLPTDALVMSDGSGLSRYNYISADLLVGILRHAWFDGRLRGPFAASLPVGGHDGTLQSRMRGSPLDRRIQAKTGTISNVRSLAGYAATTTGEKLAFAIVANHFVATNAEVDAVMERVLEEVVR
jgi:D-alanyl-D-alanine carboxypeptidase/D-alanyl-D-alanine-endopeptidase (penicillin-binding protein 4)